MILHPAHQRKDLVNIALIRQRAEELPISRQNTIPDCTAALREDTQHEA